MNRNHIPGPRVDLPSQLELPGTDPRPIDLAKMKATAQLRARKPQEPCDVGLFSDASRQTDLLDSKEPERLYHVAKQKWRDDKNKKQDKPN